MTGGTRVLMRICVVISRGRTPWLCLCEGVCACSQPVLLEDWAGVCARDGPGSLRGWLRSWLPLPLV